MAKRLHDTDCWRKGWFRSLSVQSKLLWLYLLDTCNAAGIVETDDLEQISFFVGTKITEKHLGELSKQLKRIDYKRHLILDFIEFQYGKLRDVHKMWIKVNDELAKFGLKYPIDTVSGVPDTVMDMDKDKDMDEDKDKEGGCKGETKRPTEFVPPSFEEFKAYCDENGYGNIAERAYKGYSAADWHDSKGVKIKNWKQKLHHVWFRDENKGGVSINRQYGRQRVTDESLKLQMEEVFRDA